MGENLLLFVNEVESDLVGFQVVVACEEFFEEGAGGIGQVQRVLALSNLEKVEIVRSGLLTVALVDEEDGAEDFDLAVLVADSFSGQAVCVAEEAFSLLGVLDGLLEDVDTARRNGDSNHLFKVALGEALFKFTVDDFFHAAVHLNALVVEVTDGNAALDVQIDTFVDEGLRVLVLCHNVETITCFQCKSQSLVVLLQVVKHLRRNASGKLFFGEALLLHEALNAGQLV